MTLVEHGAGAAAGEPVLTRVRTLVGYVRVATTDQSADLQVDALTSAGAERVFVVSASGATDSRPEFARALDYLREGDVAGGATALTTLTARWGI